MAKKTKLIVGKFTIDHDDPDGELPYAVVAEHDNGDGMGWTADLAYFSTRKAARDCLKELWAVLRKKR